MFSKQIQTCVDSYCNGSCNNSCFLNVLGYDSVKLADQPGNLVIIAASGSGGTISPSGVIEVSDQGNQTFNTTSDTCFMISDIIINNSAHIGEQKSPYLYTFVNVTSNHTFESVFSQRSYNITATAGTGGSITPSGVIAVLYGASQSFNIVPDNEYEITDVIIDNVSQGALRSYTLSDVRADHLISAVFTGVRSTYNINATADPYTIVYPFGNRSFSVGSNKTYVTQPKPGSDLTDVIIDNYSNGSIRSWTFTNISSDHYLYLWSIYTR